MIQLTDEQWERIRNHFPGKYWRPADIFDEIWVAPFCAKSICMGQIGGQDWRRAVQQVEKGEFKLIEGQPAETRTAA